MKQSRHILLMVLATLIVVSCIFLSACDPDLTAAQESEKAAIVEAAPTPAPDVQNTPTPKAPAIETPSPCPKKRPNRKKQKKRTMCRRKAKPRPGRKNSLKSSSLTRR